MRCSRSREQSRVRSQLSNPKCPDCGAKTVKNGKRGGGTQRFKCNSCGRRFSELTANEVKNYVEPAAKEKLREDTHVFVLTYAQNNTDIHEGFWAALGALVEHRNADLLVKKGRYRNPTAPEESKKADAQYDWDERVYDHLWDSRDNLCERLTILGDMNVIPTAKRPLTSLDSITGGKSGILFHPKLELRSIATPQHSLPKMMMTTGACTVQNYSDSKAGKIGEFHHTIGARIVEIRADVFHTREINALRDGSFIDLDWEYLPDGTRRPAAPAEALSMGDWHYGVTDPKVIDATFGYEGSMCQVLKPKVLIWDDLLDQYARNHHDRNNPFKNIVMAEDDEYDRDNLEHEVMGACLEVNYLTGEASNHLGERVKSVINSSNHDEALTRWVLEGDWKKDPVNARFYLETALRMANAAKMTETGHSTPQAFHVWAQEHCDEDIVLLGRNQSFMRKNVELGMHGDVGPNGSRGSAMNIAKIGVKTIIGHSHSPCIIDGCYQKGTSTYLSLHYTGGPSSWMQTHCVLYANGKRALLTIIDGEWRHN